MPKSRNFKSSALIWEQSDCWKRGLVVLCIFQMQMKPFLKCFPFTRSLNSHPQVLNADKPLWPQGHLCLATTYENCRCLFSDSPIWISGYAWATEVGVRFWTRLWVFRASCRSQTLGACLHLLSWDSYSLNWSTFWILWFLQVHSNYSWRSQICRFVRPGVHPFFHPFPPAFSLVTCIWLEHSFCLIKAHLPEKCSDLIWRRQERKNSLLPLVVHSSG